MNVQYFDASGAAAEPPPEMQSLIKQLSHAASGASGLNLGLGLNLDEIISTTTAAILPFKVTPRPRASGRGSATVKKAQQSADENAANANAPSADDEWPTTPRTPFARDPELDNAIPGSEVERLLARLADTSAPEDRAEAVKQEFVHAWLGYEKWLWLSSV